MNKFVRSSKVRHVYGEVAKQENQYHGLRLSSATGDQNYIKANGKYFGFSVQTGGGALTVVPYEMQGKLNPCLPVFDGHKGAVLDFDFNPFHDNIIVSGGDDTTLKVWGIPDGGLVENIMDPLVDMKGHQKKISVVRFHPSAENVVATGSADTTVKIWDIQRGECKATCTANSQLIQDIVWNYDGSLLATSCKDKVMRLVDPRTGEVTDEVIAHDGTKTSKLTWLGDKEQLVSCGFTRSSKRQFKIWDPRNLANGPITTCDIDQAAGAMMPFYDEGTKLLYICGKGDANIRYYEMTDEKPWQYHVGEYRATTPAKGLAVVPKRYCDVGRCEVSRLLKLTKNSVEPISFICPRKSEFFQQDLFPDCQAGVPAINQDDFFSGENKAPILQSMDPSKLSENQTSNGDKNQASFTPSKSAKQLENELTAAKDYIQLLENSLQENNIVIPEQKISAA